MLLVGWDAAFEKPCHGFSSHDLLLRLEQALLVALHLFEAAPSAHVGFHNAGSLATDESITISLIVVSDVHDVLCNVCASAAIWIRADDCDRAARDSILAARIAESVCSHELVQTIETLEVQLQQMPLS